MVTVSKGQSLSPTYLGPARAQPGCWAPWAESYILLILRNLLLTQGKCLRVTLQRTLVTKQPGSLCPNPAAPGMFPSCVSYKLGREKTGLREIQRETLLQGPNAPPGWDLHIFCRQLESQENQRVPQQLLDPER